MMNPIKSMQDIQELLHRVCFFHGTCITEMRYISGAYVSKQGMMYPVNDENSLEVILKGEITIRLIFHGILYCNLYPVQPEYTCEILGASMWMDQSSRVYWCNNDDVTLETVDDYNGIVVCASSAEYEIKELCFDEENEEGILVDTFSALVRDFWAWTQLPQTEWNKADISRLPVPVEEFPQLSAMQACCIRRINTPLTDEEMDEFLLCMAVDNEDEEILDACGQTGTVEFIAGVIQAGVQHPQPMARWQMAELLRRDIPNRINDLIQLCSDADTYVQKRAEAVLQAVR